MVTDEFDGDLPVLAAGSSMESLLAMAVQGGAVYALERLLVMRQTLKTEAAREAFLEAMSAFQEACPIIPKRRSVTSQSGFAYKYAPLEDIVAATAPIMRRFGLSYRFDTRFDEEPPAITVVCTISHRDGHSETSEFRSPIDSGARMNVMQKSASALSYAKRYAFCNAFGILTGDDDDDGRNGGGSGADSGAVRPRYRPDGGSPPAGEPSASPVGTPRVRDAVRIPPRTQGSDLGGNPQPAMDSFADHAAPAEIPASSTTHDDELVRGAQLVRDTQQGARSRDAMVEECIQLALAVEVGDRRQRGQVPPGEDVLLPIAESRCDIWFDRLASRNGGTGTRTLRAASMAELEGLRRYLSLLVKRMEEGA